MIYDLVELIRENRPKAVILENVKGLISHDKGETFRDILLQIKSVGYDVDYKVLNSLDYGVPHMRQRVYIIAVNHDLDIDFTKFMWPEPKNMLD